MSGRTPPEPQRPPGADLDGLFANIGDFAQAIKFGDDRLRKVTEVRNAMSERVPADGGFLVPEEFRSELLADSIEEAIVRPRTKFRFPMASLKSNVPSLDTTTNVGQIAGGWNAVWSEENTTATDTQPGFGRTSFEAKKLLAKSTINNELFEDANALNAWLRASLPLVIAYQEDDAFIQGKGQGEPMGAIYANCAIPVTRAATPSTGSSMESDITAMVQRMWPQGQKRACWLCSPDVFAVIVGNYIEAGTGPIGTGTVTATSQWLDCDPQTGDWRLLEHCLYNTEHVPAANTLGDFAYIDFGAFVIGDREAMTLQFSPHNQFQFDQTIARVRHRVDGRMWINSAYTPANGSQTVSPVVVRS